MQSFEELPKEILFQILLYLENPNDYYSAILAVPVLGKLSITYNSVFEKNTRKYVSSDFTKYLMTRALKKSPSITDDFLDVFYYDGEENYEHFKFSDKIKNIFGNVSPKVLCQAILNLKRTDNVFYDEIDHSIPSRDIDERIWKVNEECYNELKERTIFYSC